MPRPRGKPTQPTDRYARIDTALRVVRELSWGRWSVRELGKYFGLSCRSVYRLLYAIERGGISLQRNRTGHHVRYSVRPQDVRRAVGLCPKCGGSTRQSRKTCADCAAMVNEAARARRKKKIALGLCHMCGIRPSREGRQLCGRCAKTHSRAVMAYQQRQRDQGRCRICGEDAGGKARCEKHRDRRLRREH